MLVTDTTYPKVYNTSDPSIAYGEKWSLSAYLVTGPEAVWQWGEYPFSRKEEALSQIFMSEQALLDVGYKLVPMQHALSQATHWGVYTKHKPKEPVDART